MCTECLLDHRALQVLRCNRPRRFGTVARSDRCLGAVEVNGIFLNEPLLFRRKMHLGHGAHSIWLEIWLCAKLTRLQYSTNRCRPIKSGKLEQCLRRSCPDTGPHGANLAPARRSPIFSSGSTMLQGNTHQVGYDVVQTG